MRFGGLLAINDLSFQVARGGITALIGPNGAGKTTVFNCITGFYRPTQGRMALATGPDVSRHALVRVTASNQRHARDGRDEIYLLERMPGHEITAQARVARTFQNIRLFSGMTCLENLMVAQHNALMHASGYSIFGLLGTAGWKHAEAAASRSPAPC
jgi:branched-chain amino acid transport system ATP-binding protein